MKLLFDVGNTRVKAARYNNGKLDNLPSAPSADSTSFPTAWRLGERPQAIYVASVGSEKTLAHLEKWLTQQWTCDITRIREAEI